MQYSVILYRVLIKDEYRVVANYEHPKGVVFLLAHPAAVARKIESEWQRRVKEQSMAVGIDWLTLNPSVVFLVHNPTNIYKWGILTDPYDIMEMKVYGIVRRMALCQGEKAMDYWNKGRKPKLPKEFGDEG